MYLSGGLTAITGSATDAGASVGVTFVVNGVVLRDGSGQEASQLLQSINGTPTLFKSGVLSDWSSPAGIVTTPTFAVQAGEPFTLRIVPTSIASGGGSGLAGLRPHAGVRIR